MFNLLIPKYWENYIKILSSKNVKLMIKSQKNAKMLNIKKRESKLDFLCL
jgi:hypothetical protein